MATFRPEGREGHEPGGGAPRGVDARGGLDVASARGGLVLQALRLGGDHPARGAAVARTGGSAPHSGRFKRQTEWPAGSEQLWRCEIKWHAGYANSDFRAVAHGPKRHRGVTLGHSETFKWLLKGVPAASDARFLGQVRRLADRLTAAGWEPAGRGPSWYELRFVWRREGAPPEQLDPAPVEADR